MQTERGLITAIGCILVSFPVLVTVQRFLPAFALVSTFLLILILFVFWLGVLLLSVLLQIVTFMVARIVLLSLAQLAVAFALYQAISVTLNPLILYLLTLPLVEQAAYLFLFATAFLLVYTLIRWRLLLVRHALIRFGNAGRDFYRTYGWLFLALFAVIQDASPCPSSSFWTSSSAMGTDRDAVSCSPAASWSVTGEQCRKSTPDYAKLYSFFRLALIRRVQSSDAANYLIPPLSVHDSMLSLQLLWQSDMLYRLASFRSF